jgi:hypothetical protein
LNLLKLNKTGKGGIIVDYKKLYEDTLQNLEDANTRFERAIEIMGDARDAFFSSHGDGGANCSTVISEGLKELGRSY